MDTNLEPKNTNRHNPRLVAGIILILIGTVNLLQRWLDIGSYVTLLLGIGMLVLGSATHKRGWIIPGGVLTGIGLGIAISEGPWRIPGLDHSGLFLLCFAVGWFLITALSALFTDCTMWWALIPGGIMAVLGITMLVTRGNVRGEDLNLLFAAILMVIGVTLIATRGRVKKSN